MKSNKKINGLANPRKKVGPAMKSLLDQLKPEGERVPGICGVRDCDDKTSSKRGKWCKLHRAEIRKLQLKLNNVTWRKRVVAGTAGHHVVYSAAPTEWTEDNPNDALKIAKAGHSIIGPQELKTILQKKRRKAA